MTIGSWFEGFFGGYYPNIRMSPWEEDPRIIEKYFFCDTAFFDSVLHALSYQPEDYDPAWPTSGEVLPLLFQTVHESLPKYLRSQLRCYQTIDSYLDMFHKTDYLFLLGGFVGANDTHFRIDITTDPRKIARRKLPTERIPSHLTISPHNVLCVNKRGEYSASDSAQVDEKKVALLGRYIASRLLRRYLFVRRREKYGS